jgi:hypothetical protein
VLLHPQELWRREARHRNIAGNFAQAWFFFFKLAALAFCPPVVPQNCRPDRNIGPVEQRSTMHLT